MSRDPQDVILAPVVSEKSYSENDLGKFRFRVNKNASKIEIKQAVEKLFKVKVIGVHTHHVRGKFKRLGRNTGMTADWKKAIVTLAKGQRIDVFEKV